MLLAACGGGGSDSTAPFSNANGMNGAFSAVAASITPQPATTAQPLQVQFTATFTGTFGPAASSFEMPFSVTRTSGAQQVTKGTATFTLRSGQPGNGVFQGLGVLTLAAQPAGVQTFCVLLLPGQVWTFNGVAPQAACTTVSITQ
jgi:hypothetical protein